MVPSGPSDTLRRPKDIHERGLLLRRLNFRVPTPDGSLVLETADVSAENLSWLRAAYPLARIVATTPSKLLSRAEGFFGARLAQDAVSTLEKLHPALSARTVLTRGQALSVGAISIGVAASFALWPTESFRTLAVLTTTGFVVGAAFRALLAWIGSVERDVSSSHLGHDLTLPTYTILVPLYREANVVSALVRSLHDLDYPSDKLDIKLIVEADDEETVAAAFHSADSSQFHIVRVPAGEPRTKPRACNYALAFARGEFTVIYDAEDRPEPDQLRKAVAQFRSSARDIACLQARLNFYNADENWLTRVFALEYALWFDVLLPGLERLHVPMPLGGTSNHFRTSALREIGAWDPFNVTEDADLGIRLAQLGMRVAMLDSTTFEEAPTTFRAWLKQRSRWLKGYMQTWLVHMRDPASLRRRTGWRGLFSLQLFLGGSVIAALLNPILWLVFVQSIFSASPADHLVTTISAAGLFAGNALLTLLAVLAPRRRGWQGLAPYGFAVTFYWALISIAAWRALWQLVTRPYYWDKTAHGLTRFEARPKQALAPCLVLALVAFIASQLPDHAIAGAWTLKKHHWQTFNTTTLSAATTSFDHGGRATAQTKFRKLLTQNTVEYGLNDEITLFATPAYVTASQSFTKDKVIRAAGSSIEAGARILLLAHFGKLSLQTSYKAAGPFDLSDSANRTAARQIDLRLLYGTSYKLFGRDGFVDAQAAQRWITHGRPDEAAIDLTAGLWLRPDTMLMAQNFNIISGGARAPFSYYRTHKVALSLAEKLSQHWSLQVGGFLSPAGQNALAEKGLSVVLWTQR